MFNATNMTASNNLLEMMLYLNSYADGWLGIFVLIAIYIVAFLALTPYDNKTATLGAVYITAVLGIFLRAMSLISDLAMYLTWVLAGLALIAQYLTKPEV